MNSKTIASLTLISTGMMLILAGLFLSSVRPAEAQQPLPTPVRAYTEVAQAPAAQIPDDAEVIGARKCATCHRDIGRNHNASRHALALQEVGNDAKAILADFAQGEDLRTVKFPNEDTSRAFKAEDIAFAVGSGRYVQRYLYKLERDKYVVFPAEWNAVEKKWQPYPLAENWLDNDWNANCAGCHTTGLDAERGRWKDDGVQCEACHGPGSVHQTVADKAGNNPSARELIKIRAAIVLSPDPQLCGQCHSQGVSGDGKRPYPVGYRPGENLLDGYTLVAPNDTAHWRASGHAQSQNMQFNEWLTSRHASALTSLRTSTYADDSCLECHSGDYGWTEQLRSAQAAGTREGDAPDKLTLKTAQFGITCTTCHDLHNEKPRDFLLVNEPYALCVSCHGDTNRIKQVHHPVQEVYEGTQIVDNVAASPSKHFNNKVECVTCHMPTTVQNGTTWILNSHTMQPALPAKVTGDQPDSCTGCHKDLTKTYMQQFIDKTQTGIRDRLSRAEAALKSVTTPPDWLPIALDFVNKDGSFGVHNFSYASALLDAAELQLGISKSQVAAPSAAEISDPTACGECHKDQYRQWETSPHAKSSLNAAFQKLYAEKGRPSYCMRCHASGYDAQTEVYRFEGVVCGNCHTVTSSAKHPPGPVEVANASVICGRCHSGEHSPTYDEWLVSPHNRAGIDCTDCHTAHNNGLKQVDVNTTCSNCHQDAMADQIHMGEKMTCVDCHMKRQTAENGVQVVQTGHEMSIDPGTCSSCHGKIHLLSFGDTKLSDQQKAELAALKDEVSTLEEQASQNLNSGVVGGAIGALALMVIVLVIVRFGRGRV